MSPETAGTVPGSANLNPCQEARVIDGTCTADGCLRADIYAAKSCAPEVLCAPHYKIWRARGCILPHQPTGMEWRPIPGYEAYYHASDSGLIWTVRRCQLLVQNLTGSGYLQVTLSVGGETYPVAVHQLIALTFIGECPAGMEVLHGDGNVRTDNARVNLRYGTRSENLQQSVREGTFGPLRANRTHRSSSPGAIERCESLSTARTSGDA
jgi:HNH endonuclease/NUMOD4 motif